MEDEDLIQVHEKFWFVYSPGVGPFGPYHRHIPRMLAPNTDALLLRCRSVAAIGEHHGYYCYLCSM